MTKFLYAWFNNLFTSFIGLIVTILFAVWSAVAFHHLMHLELFNQFYGFPLFLTYVFYIVGMIIVYALSWVKYDEMKHENRC